MRTVHIVGAGLAGLSAALRIAQAGSGTRVVLYESAGHAGGRCRSFHDATLGCGIDNGNHLILGANPAVFAYVDGLESRPVRLRIEGPAGWPIFSTLAPRWPLQTAPADATAADFYDRFGFRPFPRAEVPDAVARSPEFASICPSSAACRVLSP